METGRFWPFLGPEMVKFASNFCYGAVDQEKAVFQWKRAVSGPSAFLGTEMVKFASNFCYCAVDQEKPFFNGNGPFLALFGARNGQICFEFLLLCCRPRKGRFSMETGRFWPFLGPEMVKCASNFCYSAGDQEKAVFQWKRVASGPSALLGPEMVKFASNFCYCAVDQEKAVFPWKRAVSGPSALLGTEMVKFASNFCYGAVDQEKAVFQWKRAVSGPSALWGARNGQICFEFLLL